MCPELDHGIVSSKLDLVHLKPQNLLFGRRWKLTVRFLGLKSGTLTLNIERRTTSKWYGFGCVSTSAETYRSLYRSFQNRRQLENYCVCVCVCAWRSLLSQWTSICWAEESMPAHLRGRVVQLEFVLRSAKCRWQHYFTTLNITLKPENSKLLWI